MGEPVKEPLKDLLQRFFSEDGITIEEFAYLEKMYGQALNERSCPCGTETKFIDCCKPEWNAAVRTKKANEADAKEQVKQTKNDGKTVRADQPIWICKIGFAPDGSIATVPLDGIPKHLKGLQIMMYISDILNAANHGAMMDIIEANVNIGCGNVYRKLTPPSEKTSEGGIVIEQ